MEDVIRRRGFGWGRVMATLVPKKISGNVVTCLKASPHYAFVEVFTWLGHTVIRSTTISERELFAQ